MPAMWQLHFPNGRVSLKNKLRPTIQREKVKEKKKRKKKKAVTKEEEEGRGK